MTEPQTKTIDGLTFSAQPLSPFAALDLVPELASVIGPSVAASTDAASLVAIARELGGGKLRALLPRVLGAITVTITEGGRPQRITLNSVETINLAFAGRLGALPEVVIFAVEVSFGDFFAGLGRAGKQLKDRPGSTGSSPST